MKRFGYKSNFASPDPKLNGRATMIEKYGVEHPYQKKEFIDKAFNTREARYGDGNYNNTKQAVETAIKKYGGVGFAVKEFNDKGKQTCEERHGSKNYNNIEKIQETNLKKYGVKSFSQTEEFQEKSHKMYIYKKEKFDSSWELAVWIYCQDFKIPIIHSPEKIAYEFNNTVHYYFPDFWINGQLVEIKGNHKLNENNELRCFYLSDTPEKQTAKQKCMQENDVRIWSQKEVTPYLKYIKEKYGKNYLDKFKVGKRYKKKNDKRTRKHK